MECSICTSEIEHYPCPLCGYNGELEESSPKRAAVVPEEEIVLEKKTKTKKKKKKRTSKKKRKKRGSPIKWLILILVLLLLGAAAAVVLTVHIWQPATCSAPETCRICRKTQGDPLPHTWSPSCLAPGTCTVCGAVQEEAPGHSWERSDCLSAGVCAVCGEPEPEAPGHDWQPASCESPETCARCGETSGSPLGHAWDGAALPAVCSRCGAELTEEQQAQCLLEAESSRIFDSLFAARNWQGVYEAAALPDAPFETAEQYAALMSAYAEQVPELQKLDSAGYAVLMGEERIAEFTLRQKGQSGWELDTMTLFADRSVTVTVQAPDGYSISVNGIPLDENYVVSRTDSPAASFLPEGTTGLQNCTWQVSGLMAEPQIAAADAAGNEAAVVRDEKTGAYRCVTAASELSEEEETMAFRALESYAAFMINASGGRAGVMKYFDNTTQTCQNILKMGSELWMNSDHGHKFKEETILASQRFSDSLLAIRASIVMETNLKVGGTRDYTVKETLFFNKKNDSWVCFAMTNQDVLTPKAAAPENADADEWADYPDGIRIEEYTGPNFNAHVMLVRDPSRVYLGLSSYNGFSITRAGKRLTEAIVDEEAVAAINAGAFYDDGTSDICVGSTPAGLTIYDGKLVSNVYTGFVPEDGFCGLDADNHLVVAKSMTGDEAAERNIRYGCEFGPVLIQDSQINEDAYGREGFNPRTAVGQRADGTMIFVCADGRQAGSLGATYGEIIDLLVEYGAVNACNMDGGSSTVMLTRDAEGEVSFVNSYSVLQSQPRRMPTFWLIRP